MWTAGITAVLRADHNDCEITTAMGGTTEEVHRYFARTGQCGNDRRCAPDQPSAFDCYRRSETRRAWRFAPVPRRGLGAEIAFHYCSGRMRGSRDRQDRN